MLNQIHILNGDALKYQLSDLPIDSVIVLREAFIEGPLNEINFFKNRAQYINQKFNASLEEYKTRSEHELGRIKNLFPDQEIVLWFEYDLFCQCNLWYACKEILKIKGSPIVSWVHPQHEEWSGFGKMNQEQLKHIFKERQIINQQELKILAGLWNAYASNEAKEIKSKAQTLYACFPKLEATIQAHLDRTDSSFLLKLSQKYLKEIPEKDFKSFYLKFQKEQGIYGFGDLHVKEYYEKALDSNAS